MHGTLFKLGYMLGHKTNLKKIQESRKDVITVSNQYQRQKSYDHLIDTEIIFNKIPSK